MKLSTPNLLQAVIIDLIERDPNNIVLGMEFLLGKGEGLDFPYPLFDPYDDRLLEDPCIESEIDNLETYLSKEEFYMYMLMHRLLSEADQTDVDQILCSIRKNDFVNCLLKGSFDSYRKDVRNNKIHRILDLTATTFSASIVCLDTIEKYHYVPITENEVIHKYVDFCSIVRSETIDIARKTLDNALLNITNKDYDAVIIDSSIDTELYDQIKSIGFGKIIDSSDRNYFEFMDPSQL